MKRALLSLLFATGISTSMLAQATPINLVNSGFEADWTGTSAVGSDGYVTFNYAPTGSDMGWAFANGGGVANSYSWLTAFEGSRFGLLQIGGTASQSFTLDTASDVTLDFELALRPGYAPGQTVNVLLDGNILGNFAAASTSWNLMTLGLGTLTAGSHSLMFAGTANYYAQGDTTAYLDAVHLDASTPLAPVSEPAPLALIGLGLVGLFLSRRKV